MIDGSEQDYSARMGGVVFYISREVLIRYD